MRNRVARAGLSSVGWLLCGVLVALAPAAEPESGPSTVLRDGFETPKVAWRQEQTDATVKIYAHERTNRAAHEGQLSEGFQFEAGIGDGLYFSYRLPNVPVTEELKVGLYVRSNRSGAQVLGRVVLPADVDPDSRRPSFVLVPSTVYENSDRWQKLELADMLPAVERQAKVIRASSRRPVSLKGAYLERLVVNIYGGEGETEVYLDELTVGPIPAGSTATPRPDRPSVRTIADRPRGPNEPLEAVQPGLNSRIRLDRNRLTKDGFPWFFTAVRAPGADPSRLRRVGCDALVVPKDEGEATIKAAIASGLLLIPELTGPDDRTLPDADRLLAEAQAFPGKDAVAFWSLGENLGRSTDLEARRSSLLRVRDAERAFRKARPGGSPLTTGTVSGMLPEYARLPENLDVVGIPTAGWATTQDPFEMYQFLEQRKLLTARSNADALLWATLDATAPPIYRESVWGTDAPPSWGEPRVQPEQLRIATYGAIAGGCRGICFRADSDLTRDLGRPALIEMALLNEEIDLLEPILADPDKAVRMIDTYLPDPPPPPPMTLFQMNTGIGSSGGRPPVPKEFGPHPTIKAASITTKDRRGTLLMIADYYKYAQYQPPQSAFNNLIVRVPAPSDAHAYLITPGGVIPLKSKREPGGIEMILDDFGLTAIILVTTNVELKDQIEQAVNSNRPKTVSLAIEQAEIMRAWVVEIDSLIQDLRHPQKDSAGLLNQAAELIKSAREALEREDYQTAWDEARRVGRPLRILMRYHFMAAYDAIIKDLNDQDLPCGPGLYEGQDKPKPRIIAPTVAAPLASFGTLPQAWIWYEWIRSGRLGRNLVPSGDFNKADSLEAGGWAPVSYQTDEIQAEVRLNEGGPDTEKAKKKKKKEKDKDDKKDKDDEKDKDEEDEEEVDKKFNLLMLTGPRQGLTLDSLVPFVDHPVAAIRSPPVKVGARQVYRISVMAKTSNQSVPGAGGLIIRDSIGGERLQFRTHDALAMDWFEVVYYRRAPADGTMTVTLGFAGYGYAAFDDFKIEPIVETIDPEQFKQLSVRTRRRAARTPASPTSTERPGSDATATNSRASTANRPRPLPIRQ